MINDHLARIVREADERAAGILANAHPCAVCKDSMIAWPGRLRHWGCEPDSLAGKVCTCPSGCSGSHWGSGPNQCDPGCQPCRQMRGRPLAKRTRS